MGYWPPEEHLIFYIKKKAGKNQKQPSKPTNSSVITYKVLYKLGNLYIALNMQACIFSTRCQTTNNFGFI